MPVSRATLLLLQAFCSPLGLWPALWALSAVCTEDCMGLAEEGPVHMSLEVSYAAV